MRKQREAAVAGSPPPQFFKLSAELLAEGRSNQIVADTGTMVVNLKVYASGGENGLHNHGDEDHFHLVMSGRACFYGPRGEEKILGPFEGVMLPAGCFYRFHAIGDAPLVLLRVAAKLGTPTPHRRYNVYGEPLPSGSKENGYANPVPLGVFWGAGT